LFKSVHADKEGHFRMFGIAPGEYKLFAWDKLEGYEYFDQKFLERFEEKGIAVSVGGSSRLTLELKVLSRGEAP
jgi:hypothetical protein